MSEEQIEETFKNDTEPPVEPEAEEDVQEAAEALADADGYPAETVDGKLVRIVEKRGDGQGQILVDSDGAEYRAEDHHGQIVPVEAA